MYVLALIIFAGVISFNVDAQTTAYLPGTEDFPLMNGISITGGENDPQDIVFSTPQGRIIIFEGKSKITANKILSFYHRTLKNMGWIQKASNIFLRDQEIVTITIMPNDTQNSVRFTFKPLS